MFEGMICFKLTKLFSPNMVFDRRQLSAIMRLSISAQLCVYNKMRWCEKLFHRQFSFGTWIIRKSERSPTTRHFKICQVSHARYKKKKKVESSTLIDGGMERLLTALSVSSLLMHYFTREYAWMEWRCEGQTKSLWHQKSGSCKYINDCHRNYFEIATWQDSSYLLFKWPTNS